MTGVSSFWVQVFGAQNGHGLLMHANVYVAVIMAKPLTEFTRFI